MLSDEEKKAILELNHYCNLTQYWKNVEYTKPEFDNYITTILNLIEKQQKEIEELKKKKFILNAETGEIKEIPVSDNYISKDKVKANIEEIDIEIQCCEYADDDTEEYKQDIEKEKRRLLRDKAVLQSLLEKE